jgi:signal transduction histidine kinase/ActR/RegA family two-component response regulator
VSDGSESDEAKRAGAEDELLRSVALQNARSILAARQRAERELVLAKEALEQRTRELSHSLALIRATLESTTDGILVIDSANRVADFNENFLEMWRIPRASAEAAPAALLDVVWEQFPDPALARHDFQNIMSSAVLHTADIVELADGRVFERSSKTQRVGERDVGRVWTFRDITEARRAEEERQQLLESERAARSASEKMSAIKDQFLATLSHELRTPLNAIVGWAQILLAGNRRESDMQKGLETIERNARMQAQLIDDLLDMSRIVSGKVRLDIQPTDPSSIIDAALETVRPAAEAKDIRFEKAVDLATGMLSADPNRLQQVIWNLLSNAIKFTPKGGKVQVVLERVNSHVELSVTDTGIGIKPEFLPHVFERFRQADSTTTRRYGGLGLGLSIVKHLAELHGGTVTVTSPGEGKGATFTVSLPLMVVHQHVDHEARQHPKALGAAGAELENVDLAGVTILVVDDEADARDMLERVLVECSARVMTAGSAEEALALIRIEPPHVLISDIGMPDVDGYELLKRAHSLMQSHPSSLAAIALTAFARSEDRTRALRAGFLMHLSKPVHAAELIASVASVTMRLR